ncbi:hypothetical protein MCHI_002140 [Candidatus Magnetoovum chiemensis]|nr:hypothetical protein MCHI_002140 [Candidatus Magnetoovum chiemensis]
MKVISNSSPLIGLSSLSISYVLKELFNEIYIPEAVYNEVVEKGEGRYGQNEIKQADQKIIIDELRARKYMEKAGFEVTGTLGILVLAKRMGIVANVKEQLNALITNGFRIAKPLYYKTLKKAGEEF